MSDTPEIDKVEQYVQRDINRKWVLSDFAKRIERERDEAMKEIERLKWRLNHCAENIGDLVAIKFATSASDVEIDSAMKGDK